MKGIILSTKVVPRHVPLALRGGGTFVVWLKGDIMQTRIVLVGSGHLAHALFLGWQRDGAVHRTIHVLARSTRLFAELWTPEEQTHITFDPDILQTADIVVFTVKPKDMSDALSAMSPYLNRQALVLSPVAGYSLEQIRRRLPHHGLVRFMPNICSAIGASVTLFTPDGLTAAQKTQVESLIAELGPMLEVEESLINPMTALLGSGPAYVYLFMEAVIQAGEQLGVDRELTRLLVGRMIEGSARLAEHEGATPLSQLIRQVVSPGGTTEAMLNVLKKAEWGNTLTGALLEAGERAIELGQYSA